MDRCVCVLRLDSFCADSRHHFMADDFRVIGIGDLGIPVATAQTPRQMR